MLWILLTIGTVCVVECFLRSPLLDKTKTLTTLVSRIGKVLKSSSISDHWKEKVLPRYALQLFSLSLQLFFWVIVSVLPLIIIALIADLFLIPLTALISSLLGIGVSTAVACIYLLIRRRVFA